MKTPEELAVWEKAESEKRYESKAKQIASLLEEITEDAILRCEITAKGGVIRAEKFKKFREYCRSTQDVDIVCQYFNRYGWACSFGRDVGSNGVEYISKIYLKPNVNLQELTY